MFCFRLQSYDSPIPPPSLRTSPPVIPPILKDALLHRNIMLDSLKPSFKAVLDYAQYVNNSIWRATVTHDLCQVIIYQHFYFCNYEVMAHQH